MKGKNIEIDKVIAGLLSGEGGWEDMLTLNEWLEEDPRNRTEFVALGKYWNCRPTEKESAADSFSRAKEKIFCTRAKSRRAFGYRRLRQGVYATVFSLVTLLLAAIVVSNAVTKEYTYSAGDSIGKFTLPDGSNVTLNKGCILNYSEAPLRRERQASLSGEAYFDIRHDSRHPFCVHAGDARIKVLGTRFGARLSGDGSVSTALEEGSVKFVCGKVSETLSPGETLSYSFDDGTVTKTSGDVESFIAWKNGIVRYRSKPLSAIAEEISATYGCNVLIDSQLKDILMSGAFFADQSLEDVLRILQSCLNVNWVINDNTVYLSSK